MPTDRDPLADSAPLASADSQPADKFSTRTAHLGEVIDDRYEVERVLGKGGFGTTYAAMDRQTGNRVALKMLDLHRVSEWKSVELFEREAKVLRTLKHPGIPAYVEFRPLEEARAAYLVQALAPGENLERLLETRRFTEPELITLARRVLEILAYLSKLHPVVVHRDLKPANILLAEDGTLSLVDFGAVRDVATATMGGGSTVAGTFGYMAPEQLHGEAHPSSDLYGLGMTLIHLATGRVPSDFATKRLKPDFRAHVHFSDDFEELIDRLIEPIPDDRYQLATEVLEALDRIEGLRSAVAKDAAPSAVQIALQRKAAEEEHATALARREVTKPTKPTARHLSKQDRASFAVAEDVAELVVRPARFWRGREIHYAFAVMFGLGGMVAFAGKWGALGAGVGLVVLAAVLAALAATAPTWRLRMTDDGDFIFYARNPKRPKWIGRCAQLTIENIRTANGDHMAQFLYKRDPRSSAWHHFYPISAKDAGRFASAKHWAKARR